MNGFGMILRKDITRTSEQIIAVVQRSIARVSATDKLIVQMDNENIEFCERSRIESMFKSEFIRVLCVIS